MALRFDRGEIKSPFKNHDGSIVAEAVFARDGILEYVMPDGKTRKEFRPPDENRKAITEFGLLPVTIEHPPVLVNEDNANIYRKGVSLQNVQYGKGGFVKGEIIVMDSDAIQYMKDGGAEISAGYTCTIEETPGIWNGQHYDAVQRNVRANHLALTKRGRAGPDVRVYLDSADSDVGIQVSTKTTLQPKRMATLRIDSIEYEVPEAIAPVLGQKLSKLDSLERKATDLESQVEDLESKLDSAVDERDRERGRADAQDICLTNAEIILESLGYRRDASGDYIRADMGKKKYMDMDEDEMEDDDMDMEEEMPKKKKGMKKDMGKEHKKDSADEGSAVRVDAKELSAAWREAEKLTGESIEDHMDSLNSPALTRKWVVAKLRPSMAEKLDSMDAGAIDGIYTFLKEDAESQPERSDARSAGSSDLQTALGVAWNTGKVPQQGNAVTNPAYDTAWQEPLSLSR